jgi:hypothetical protein
MMRLVQFVSVDGERHVARVHEDGETLQILQNASRIYNLALEAWRTGCSLEEVVASCIGDRVAAYDRVIADKRLLPPLDHADPAHCYVSGTGLTHLGSAKARDEMHVKVDEREAQETDSMRMFRWGVEGGRPPQGEKGVQPEWFFKGNGFCVVPPEHSLELPAYALDGGEEAELVGLYVIADSGRVLRVGFALGNEFSDHVMERQNYLYLAHSKLRACSIGPELLVGPLPESIVGRVRVLRHGEELWAETFYTGEKHMSHTIANLEHHHFKYEAFRQPGDVHCHFFGTGTLSSAAGVVVQPGDLFEISADLFGRPLRNRLTPAAAPDRLIAVEVL